MPVQEKWMYEASDGSLHNSRDLAEHHNGLLLLKQKLQADFSDSDIPQAMVLQRFQDWYLTYLEGKK